jgi:hypothetical protein
MKIESNEAATDAGFHILPKLTPHAYLRQSGKLSPHMHLLDPDKKTPYVHLLKK